MMLDDFRHRGFLPSQDPLTAFPDGSPYRLLDEVGDALPERLGRDDFRDWVEKLEIPPWGRHDVSRIPELRLYYVRLGFLASGQQTQGKRQACNRHWGQKFHFRPLHEQL